MMRLLTLAVFAAAIACSTPQQAAPEPIVSPFGSPAAGATWRIFQTSDEHGWMEGQRKNGVQIGGFALLRRHLAQVGFAPQRDLLLSGGDMWTGPALSTLLRGEPMVRLFNLTGYIATAVGNHEFDFGREVLAERIKTSRFAYLAANLFTADGGRPDGVLGHLLVERGGRRIGIIGLANRATPLVTMPAHVEGLRFAGYGDAALSAAQALSGAGAQDLVVLVHDDARTLLPHLEALKPYGLRAVLGGHVHRSDVRTVSGVHLCTPADRFSELCRVERRDDGSIEVELVALRGAQTPADPEVDTIVAAAKAEAERRAGSVLTRLSSPLTRGPTSAKNTLGKLVGLGWLAGVPSASVAITNRGGLRQNLAAGPLREVDLIGVMPFSNELVVVTLSGVQLKEVLQARSSMVTGARVNGDQVLVRGAAIGPSDRVVVVVNDFMYSGGDGYRFPAYDAPATITGIPWRAPVRVYLKRFKVLSPEQIHAEWEAMQPLN